MYLIVRTKDFEKSYEKVKHSGRFKQQAKNKLEIAIDILASGKKLPREFKDHQLFGELKEYRECHIKGNLLLIYQIRDNESTLVLVSIGTHSYLRIQ
jgi:mRNA interferase YafQ